MPDILTLLHSSPTAWLVPLFVFGACVGSFLNVVALRLPTMLFHDWRVQCRDVLAITGTAEPPPPNLVQPPSRCPDCGTRLPWFHNIPVLGYIALRGRCGFCNKPIAIRYPLVELGTALLSVQVGAVFGPSAQCLFALPFIYLLLVLTLIDLEHQLLPDNLVLPLLWLGLLANLGSLFADLHHAIVGAVVGYLSLWLLYHIHRKLTGKEGIGYGDFKLLAALGAWFGWQALPVIILLASLVGTLIALGLMLLRNHHRDIPIAFGPYLALGGWVFLFWGPSLMASYFSVLRL